MNKKLMAVAVAGALVAPAAAMAQSNVQVFGNIYMEYSFVRQGSAPNGTDAANPDVLQTPGSEIGFKGEEKLGGGMSAWFQCASTADYRGTNGDGFCTRNSAIGLKGGFGNLFVGNWDTPYKRTQINTGGRDTGIYGTAFLLSGNSTTVSDGVNTGVFKRRQRNLISYDSPSFGGFKVMGAFTSTNSSTATPQANVGAKPRIWSLGASYKAGNLDVGAGYEQHDKMYNANGAGTFAGDGQGWHVGASYLFGTVKVGGMYTHQEGDPAAGANAEVKAWQLGAEWKIAGPHSLHFGYTQADDMKGTAGASMGPVRPNVGVDTGAKLWQVRYLHDFSKRTVGSIGFVNLKNDTNANYDLGGVSGSAAGAKHRAVAVSLSHKF
jgi:predicted porin